MTPEIVVRRYGGVARWGELLRHGTAAQVRAAVAAGELRRVARGRYATAELPDVQRLAALTGGVASHLSAAQLHRLALLLPPTAAHVTVRSNAHPAPACSGTGR